MLLGCLSRSLNAETLVLVAGGQEEKDGVPATRAKLHGPFAVDADRDGNFYIAEMTGHRVLRVDPRGLLTTLAGTGDKGASGDDGPARRAQFNGMHSLAVGKDGAIYVADTWNQCVRKVDPRHGTIARFAGTGRKGFNGDGGPAMAAEFGGVYCLAFSPMGDRLFIADLDNRRVRAIDMATGTVDTVAGNGERGVPPEGGEARNSPLVDPRAVAADAHGNVYILERSGDALRVVDSTGRIHTLVGRGADCRDENGRQPLPLKGPKHLCIDLAGNVLIADTENHLIRKYLPGKRQLIRIAGAGEAGASGLGGPPLAAQLKQPHGVFVHPSGAVYIADSSNDRIVKLEP
ncbi:MAG: hypothetical protein HYX69_01205 [Planctomycetia bacterium]|nr:hypothetical protein [Planctomycetia bacterium]